MSAFLGKAAEPRQQGEDGHRLCRPPRHGGCGDAQRGAAECFAESSRTTSRRRRKSPERTSVPATAAVSASVTSLRGFHGPNFSPPSRPPPDRRCCRRRCIDGAGCRARRCRGLGRRRSRAGQDRPDRRGEAGQRARPAGFLHQHGHRGARQGLDGLVRDPWSRLLPDALQLLDPEPRWRRRNASVLRHGLRVRPDGGPRCRLRARGAEAEGAGQRPERRAGRASQRQPHRDRYGR